MFDFPTTPADGTEYTSGGITYVYNATTGVWDLKSGGSMSDYVLKAGDTMTGTLNGTNIRSIGDGTVGQLWMSAGDTTRTGNLEWRMVDGARQAYMGWALKSDWISFKTEDSCKGLYMTGGADLFMGDGSGLHWGNTSAKTSHIDFSEGICLYGYGSTSQFGFNVTSGTLGYGVENVGNRHCFTVGNVERFIINKDGAYNVTGHFRTGEVDGLGIRMYGSAYIYKKVGTGMVLRRSANNVQWQTEMNDGSGTTPVASSSLTTFKDMGLALPDLKDDPELQPFARKDEGIEGFDVAKVLTLMLAKIRTLEGELATLKGT